MIFGTTCLLLLLGVNAEDLNYTTGHQSYANSTDPTYTTTDSNSTANGRRRLQSSNPDSDGTAHVSSPGEEERLLRQGTETARRRQDICYDCSCNGNTGGWWGSYTGCVLGATAVTHSPHHPFIYYHKKCDAALNYIGHGSCPAQTCYACSCNYNVGGWWGSYSGCVQGATAVTHSPWHPYVYHYKKCDAWMNFIGHGHCPPKQEMWTAIFVADMEANYRHHSTKHAARRVSYIKDLKNQNIMFNDHPAVKVDPKLVIHGGDINADHWCREANCMTGALRRTPELEYAEIWGQLYNANIPMISNWGNHDWTQGNEENKNDGNNKSRQFSKMSFEKSSAKGLTYTRYTHATGVDVYKAEFKGLQIAMFQQQPDFKGTLANSQTMVNALDSTKPTMFVNHYPITHMTATERTFMTDTISGFPTGSHHFSGHTHQINRRDYTPLPHPGTLPVGSTPFSDYTAAYPHPDGGDNGDAAPGFYAVLVHPTNGIVEVMNIEAKEPGCLARGAYCVDTHVGSMWLAPSCRDECCNNKENWEWWYKNGYISCGKETRWGAGTRCFNGGFDKTNTCKWRCANGYHNCGKNCGCAWYAVDCWVKCAGTCECK